jgi:hypothetical protein
MLQQIFLVHLCSLKLKLDVYWNIHNFKFIEKSKDGENTLILQAGKATFLSLEWQGQIRSETGEIIL